MVDGRRALDREQRDTARASDRGLSPCAISRSRSTVAITELVVGVLLIIGRFVGNSPPSSTC